MLAEAARFLEDLTGRYARLYTAALGDMLVHMTRGNRPALDDARKRLEEVITATMGVAEVLGARLTLQRAARAIQGDRFAKDQSLLPRVTFDEAVQDMIDRAPATVRNAAERTAQTISRLYSEGRVVAFARSAEHAVTERVQALITKALREGTDEIAAGREIRMTVDRIREETEAWTEGYARMAFRTNVNTAVTAGRFRQAQDPDVKQVVPCFRFDAVGDADTRSNHRAADGVVMKVDNTAWRHLAPPLGYNCRCSISYVTLPMLRRMGRIDSNGNIRETRPPASAGPDAGFRHGGRPDLLLTSLA